MPIPLPLLLPLLTLGAGVTSQGANMIQQGAQNRRQRKYQILDYRNQRADALADWNMQNEYNSPSAQMQRLKDAGLNPNLVYGNGTVGNSASAPRQTNMDSSVGNAPQIDLQEPLMGYADIMMKNAQLETMQAQRDVLAEEAMLKNVQQLRELTQIDRTKIGTATAEFDLMMKHRLAEISFESQQVGLKQKYANLKYTLDENERREIQLGRNVIESTERVLNYQLSRTKDQAEIERIKEATELLKKDNRVREYAAKLADKGLDPNSPPYIKLVETFIGWLKGGGKDRTLPYLLGDETDAFGRDRNNLPPTIRNSDRIP